MKINLVEHLEGVGVVITHERAIGVLTNIIGALRVTCCH